MVVAHPDDEVLGCGGAILRHTRDGDTAQVVFLADGFESREGDANRNNPAKQASKSLGCRDPIFLEYPDNQLDTIPLLTLVKEIEKIVEMFQPNIVYTHSFFDLNIDHQVTHRAVITACRPQPRFCVKEIYSFEVLSATGWASQSMSNSFSPTYFVAMDETTLKERNKALEYYDTEMRLYPHARSYESVKALSMYRGSVAGVEYAEAFQVERIIKSNVVSIRPASINDMSQYYDWVNETTVRDNSFNSDPIDWQTHKKWFNERINSEDCLLCVAEVDGKRAGQARFERENDELVNIDFSVDYKFRGQGVAKSMLVSAMKHTLGHWTNFSEFQGKVKRGNKPSHRVFLDLGFVVHGNNNEFTVYRKTI